MIRQARTVRKKKGIKTFNEECKSSVDFKGTLFITLNIKVKSANIG